MGKTYRDHPHQVYRDRGKTCPSGRRCSWCEASRRFNRFNVKFDWKKEVNEER